MMRRASIALAIVMVLAPISGCGLAMRKMEGESLWTIGTVTRSYRYPAHRVALATLETMRSVLVTSDFSTTEDSAFSPADQVIKSKGPLPKEGDSEIPPNFPAFWMDWKTPEGGRTDRQLMVLVSCHFEGKTQDGETVVVAVRMRPEGTLLTVHVGKRGNGALSDLILNQVADNLAHPTYLPGSREEAEAMRAFFDGPEGRAKLLSLVKPKAEEPKK